MINDKRIIREAIAKLKQSLPEETIADLSRKIGRRLEETDLFQEAGCVAFYYAMGNEVRTSELIEAWCTIKKIVLPVVDGVDIHFHPYTGKDNLKTGAFGIAAPVSDEIIPPEAIDLFIVPGIAFDYACNRLGRGRGYYDRYLSGIDKPAIGLCFDFQLVDSLPSEKHDKKMTLVLTESNWIIES